MNITVINGTGQEDADTFRMKNTFFAALGDGHCIDEFALPDAFPAFCIDCKACVCQSIYDCPHSAYTAPLWEKILDTHLIVFVLPSTESQVPLQMMRLLDHYYAKFMAHLPEANMSRKQAVVLTNETGLSLSKNTRILRDGLDDWGFDTHAIQKSTAALECQSFLKKDKTLLQIQCEKVAFKIQKKQAKKKRMTPFMV